MFIEIACKNAMTPGKAIDTVSRVLSIKPPYGVITHLITVIQYGFITLFVAAFSFGPFFALIDGNSP